ncbi:MAG: DUF3024 domain-containing protein [Pseudomonadota bacterium]
MFTELEQKRIEKCLLPLLKERTDAHVMSGGTVDFSVKGHEVLLFTKRPHFQDPTLEITLELAKFKFVRTTGLWNLFWQRANGRWQSYEPLSSAKQIETLVKEVDSDPYGCFWG